MFKIRLIEELYNWELLDEETLLFLCKKYISFSKNDDVDVLCDTVYDECRRRDRVDIYKQAWAEVYEENKNETSV